MPITLTEFYTSRETRSGVDRISVTQIFTVDGTGNPQEAEAQGPSYEATLVQRGYVLTLQSKQAVRIAPDSCRLTCIYGTPEDGGGLDAWLTEEWEMDLTSGQEHITNVKDAGKQLHYPGGPDSDVDIGTAIGVAPDGSVEGVDIYVPKGAMTIRKTFATTEITQDYLADIKRLRATVNKNEFKGNQPGEVLFLGARLSRQEVGYINGSFFFLVEANKENLQYERIGGGVGEGLFITVPEKKGWQYIWQRILQRSNEAADGSTIVQEGIASVHLATVYDEEDWEPLKLRSEL